VKGMVSRVSDYKESDRLVTIISPEAGRLTVNARGARKPKSPFLAGTQLFCYGEFTVKRINGFWYLSQCDLIESFFDLRTDFFRLDAASAVMRLLEYGTKNGEPNPELFYHAYSTTAILTYGENPPADGLICFLLNFLRIMGYTPGTTRCALCGRSTYGGSFNFDVGGICRDCEALRGGEKVQPLTLEAMRRMLCISLENMKKVLLPDEVRRECAACLSSYFEVHFSGGMKVKEALNRLINNNQ